MTAVALDLIDEGGAGGFDRLTLAAVAARAGVAVLTARQNVGGHGEVGHAALVPAEEVAVPLGRVQRGEQHQPGQRRLRGAGRRVDLVDHQRPALAHHEHPGIRVRPRRRHGRLVEPKLRLPVHGGTGQR